LLRMESSGPTTRGGGTSMSKGSPFCHLDDIIASKAAANRQRDRESLPRLRAFRKYWLKNRKQ